MRELPPTRAAIDPAYTWDLRAIYKDDSDWEAIFEQTAAALPDLDDLRGQVAMTANNLYQVLALRDRLAATIDRLVLYAELRRDEDTTNVESRDRADRAAGLLARFGASTSFIRPEILTLSKQTFAQFLDNLPAALRDAGTDMTTARPIELAMRVFTDLLDRFETLT